MFVDQAKHRSLAVFIVSAPPVLAAVLPGGRGSSFGVLRSGSSFHVRRSAFTFGVRRSAHANEEPEPRTKNDERERGTKNEAPRTAMSCCSPSHLRSPFRRPKSRANPPRMTARQKEPGHTTRAIIKRYSPVLMLRTDAASGVGRRRRTGAPSRPTRMRSQSRVIWYGTLLE